MGKIREYIDKIGENRKQEDMEKLGDMLAELICSLKESHHELYEKYKMELYIMAYGKVLNEEMAEEIVEHMKPFGEHWNMETTTKVKNQYDLKDISDVDFYVTLNSKYNDNKDTVEKFLDEEEERLDMYVSLTKDFIKDPDAKKGKVFTYFMVVPE